MTVPIFFFSGSQQGAADDKTSAIAEIAAFTGKKILLVEDNAVNRLVAGTLLRRHGAAVTEAEDGEIALVCLQQETFDLVLMDVQLPNKDGLEATRIIREEISASLPVIALTASSFPGEQEICLKVGMNDFIAKPLEEGPLMTLLGRWLERKNISLQPPARSGSAQVLYDLARLRAISNGDEAFLKKMILLFIHEMPAAMEQIRLALDEQQPETAQYAAHRAHPAAHHMGLYQLAADIKKMETLAAQGISNSYLKELARNMERTVHTAVEQLQAAL